MASIKFLHAVSRKIDTVFEFVIIWVLRGDISGKKFCMSTVTWFECGFIVNVELDNNPL